MPNHLQTILRTAPPKTAMIDAQILWMTQKLLNLLKSTKNTIGRELVKNKIKLICMHVKFLL